MVVGGGAAGVYGAIQAKTVAPDLSVVIIEKGKPLSKVSNCLVSFAWLWLILPSWYVLQFSYFIFSYGIVGR